MAKETKKSKTVQEWTDDNGVAWEMYVTTTGVLYIGKKEKK